MADEETAVVRFSAPDEDDLVTQAQPPVSQPPQLPPAVVTPSPQRLVQQPELRQPPVEKPATAVLPDTDEIDMSFLDKLANSRKLKTRTANSDYMAEHEDLELYAEDDLVSSTLAVWSRYSAHH